MKHIKQAGGIVLHDSGKVLMVQALTRKWTFPKGAVQANESLEAAARREISEETGVTKLQLVSKLGSYERPGFTKENLVTPSVIKEITFFFFKTDQAVLTLEDKGTLTADWVNLAEVADKLSYAQDRQFFIDHCDKL